MALAAGACVHTEPAPTPPCGGQWGAIDPSAVQVRVDGDDGGDGTAVDPVATLGRALELARSGGNPAIGVGPGTFPATLALDARDGGFVLAGCGPDGDGATVLAPATEDDGVLAVTAATGVVVTDVRLDGGARPLFVWGGAEVTARHVAITEPTWSGFVVDGPYTVVTLDDVTVDGARAVGGVGGYGGELSGGVLVWTGGGATGNTAAGIVASGSTASLTLTDVTVAGTLPAADGRFGRGVQVQDYASATLDGGVLADNADAGLFALGATSVALAHLDVSGTVVAQDGDGGDGIVITGSDALGRVLDPALFQADLADNVVDGSARASIVVDHATATLDGNTGAGALWDRVAQNGAVVDGSDVVFVLDEPLSLELDPLAPVGRR